MSSIGGVHVFSSSLRLALISLLCLFLSACGGNGSSGAAGNSPQAPLVTVTSNEFELARNVLELGPDVTVVSVDETSVTLSGIVPQLTADTVIIKNEGELIFERKVVSVQRSADRVVVRTLPATLADIYDSANIRQTQVISPEVLAQLQPSAPGLTLGVPIQGRHQSTGDETAVPLTFKDFAVKDGGGRTVGYLNGSASIVYGFEQSVSVRGLHGAGTAHVITFQLVPFSHCSANVTFTGVADGFGGATIPLTQPVTFNLAKMGKVAPRATCQLLLRWNGSVEPGVSFHIGGGNLGNPLQEPGVETRVGARFLADFENENPLFPAGYTEIQEFDGTRISGSILTPPESEMDFDLRLIEIRSDVQAKFFKPVERVPQIGSGRFKGIDSISLRQDVLRFRLRGTLNSTNKLAGTLTQLFNWSSNTQWTSYSLDPNNPVEDVTEEVDKSLAYFLARTETRELATAEVDPADFPVPLSLTVPQLRPTSGEPIARVRRGLKVSLTAVGGFDVPEEDRRFRPTPAVWTSSDPSVVRILKARGRTTTMEAVAPGMATIICTDLSGQVSTRGAVQVVPPGIDSVRVTIDEPFSDPLTPRVPLPRPIDGPPLTVVPPDPDPFTGPLEPGTDVPLKATATWSDGAVQDVTNSVIWSIEDNGVASLEGTLLRAEFPGTVRVTATLNPDGPTIVPFPIVSRGVVGGAEFTVRYPEGSNLDLLPHGRQQIGLGSTLGFRAFGSLLDGSFREITAQADFASSDGSVASIGPGGLATGLAAGRTNIQAAFGGATAAVDLLVQDPPLTELSIQTPGTSPNQGSPVTFRATGRYADGSSRDVTNRVRWSSVHPEILTLNGSAGLALAPGTATIEANLDGITSLAQVTVTGPLRLVVTSQPSPPNLAPGAPFTVTVEVWDLRGRVAGATNEITLALREDGRVGPSLTGQVVRSAVDGVAVFDDLRLDTVGTGYVILASSPGLSSALTQALNVGGAPAGHIFVANDNSPVGAVNSLAVSSTGVPAAVAGSPFATSGRSHAIERVSNLVVTADLDEPTGNCRLSIFQLNPATGALTPAASSPTAPFATNFNPLHTASNGTDTVFVLAEFDATVHAIRLDPSDGNVLSTNTQPIPGGAQPNELAFRASTGGGPDLLFVIQGNGGGNNVHAFSYDGATGLLTPGPITSIPAGILPGGVTVVGSRLYVTNQGPAADTISAFDITLATGALNFLGSVPTGGSSSGALHHLAHPVVGDLLFCANGPPEDTIAVFTINGATGQPVPLGTPIPVGTTNPHQFADLNLGGGRFALYVTASTRVAAFLVDPTTAALTAVTGAPFAGFNSPFGIAR